MIGQILQPELINLIEQRNFHALKEILVEWTPADVAEVLSALPPKEGAILFRLLPKDTEIELFELLDDELQFELIRSLGRVETAAILNEMSPDDRTDLLEDLPASLVRKMITYLSPEERHVAQTLLGYPEESIGRLMTPDYVAIKEDWTVAEVLEYIRENGEDSETINILYVIDKDGRLVDDLKIRELLLVPLDTRIEELKDDNYVYLEAYEDQETAVEMFKKYDRIALPVTDSSKMLMGIVTVDDVLDVAEEEATEDIHKLGAVEALTEPYPEVPMLQMVRKRAGWLSILFVGEMLTASAMGMFQGVTERAAVLMLFLPLIISSGGNSGSQAATLVIRALSLGEISLRDWWYVMKREVLSGLLLGGILAVLGFLKIAIIHTISPIILGEYWALIGLTVSFTLVGIVMWGTLMGSMLPIILEKMGFDPAASSAPFVATLVDVTGLIIYFSIAIALLTGTLL